MGAAKMDSVQIVLRENREGVRRLVVEVDERYATEDWLLAILSRIEELEIDSLVNVEMTLGTYVLSFETLIEGDEVVFRLGYEYLVDGKIEREFDLSGAVDAMIRATDLMERTGGSWSRYDDRVLVSENAFVGSGFYMQRMSDSDGVLSGANMSGLMWYVGSSGGVEAGALHYEVVGDLAKRYPYVRDVLVLPEDWMAVFEEGKLVGICDESSDDRMDVLK